MKKMDEFLESRLKEYNEWLEEKTIDYSSKVVPVKESLEYAQWILPTGQVTDIIKNAETIALSHCLCRSHYKRCDNPLSVCLLLDSFGQRFIEKRLSKSISYTKAVQVLKQANNSGLVHLALYRPDHKIYALCSCCACCCHDLQLLLDYNQAKLTVHSDYISETDSDLCTHCGVCVERCPFKARIYEEDKLVYDIYKCYGCGLCVTTCPVDAIALNCNNC